MSEQKLQFILDYLSQQDSSITEYQLLSYIEESQPYFFPQDEKFSLFKKHFYLFHQLYKLNDTLLEKDQCLIISALEIRLCSVADSANEIGRVDGLKSFYLDENNLNLSENEITEMMQLFWKKYMAVEQKIDAIKALGLENELELNKTVIKQRYNELAKKHHPDKGGDKKLFIEVKKAYDELKLIY